MTSIWDVKGREKQEDDQIAQRRSQIEGAISLAKRAAALQNHPDHKAFLTALKGVRAAEISELINEGTLSDSQLHTRRGRIQGMNDILYLLESTSNNSLLLEAELADLKQKQEDLAKRRPNPMETT